MDLSATSVADLLVQAGNSDVLALRELASRARETEDTKKRTED